MIVQHLLEMRKAQMELRHHPMTVIYGKHVQFVEAVFPILRRLNSFITSLDVWLAEKGAKAAAEVAERAKDTKAIWDFRDIIEAYALFLPATVIEEANSLFAECLFLSNAPDSKKAHACIERLFKFENSLRHFMGVERLSEELFKALGSHRKSRQKDIAE